MKRTIILWTFLSALFIITACTDKDDNIDNSTITVATPEIKASTGNSISLSSSVTGGSNQIIKKGFCYSINVEKPTIKDNVIDADNEFCATITNLPANTSYYIRAYIYGNSRYTYSNTIKASTAEISIDEKLKNYIAPEYEDYYVNIADWNQRSKWNLANVHDPSVTLAEDGYYYMYQTDASYGNAHTAGGHFHCRRSKDLVNWEYLGGVMSSLPDWVIPKLNEIRNEMGLAEVSPNTDDFGYWAPCMRKVKNGLYRLYYSIVCPGNINGTNSWSERAFIGVMENSDPSNNNGWIDKGYVITNASDKGLNYNINPTNWANCYFKWNAIDPSYIIDKDGKHFLIYGSWHSGIVALEINAETGKPSNNLPLPWGTNENISDYGSLIATRQMGNRWQASEGPEIVYNAETGYYYLFLAYDALDVPYNTRVVRSKNITGPYVGIDGTDVTNTGGEAFPIVTHPYKFNGSDGWVGISHCAVFDDGNGNWYYSSQGRFPSNVQGNAYSNALMMGHIRCIIWTKDGWPLVMPERYGNVPQTAITESELIGTWENIDLAYNYGKQDVSVSITLGEDHKVKGGDWEGKEWSYNANEQILNIDSNELYLKRECDWEASPRTHTIVYAGYNGNKTFWGKKNK